MSEKIAIVGEAASIIADLHRQLEPSPCGKPGHRRCDWVEAKAFGETSVGKFAFEPAHCLACQREEAIAAAERERCARHDCNVDEVLLREDWETTVFCSCGYKEEAKDTKDGFNKREQHIRSLGPATALDGLLAKARDEALAACLEIRADNAQFGLPKWVKDEINKLRKDVKP